ncbi:hypothetical protein GALMADRAFT_222924 [Galerina marginata CBS 339.88]|uniref:DNA-directed RNA polymerase III subunit n=1 Tax=Galerina marginata (strain CBS 339.88) TaxID=685588 RepID=A0A067TM32_GALM3|nr:hypothetical protein GALMADRAFT_222924 [Galerina marginata CBS 339.88]
MSRGGGRGGWGGRGGRGGFGGGATVPPMGLSYAEMQNLPREATALYPVMAMPVFTEPSNDEKQIAQLQLGFAARLRKSQYYVVEKKRTTELERYSDKYRPSAISQPTLKRKELHEPFFPTEVLEDYFNPKRKKKASQPGSKKSKLNLDELDENGDDQEKSSDERTDAGSQAAESDYDVDEEYDNDYAENYFDNGEGDDMDDLGGGGGDEGGGGGDYD